jgi:hypothetical protein
MENHLLVKALQKSKRELIATAQNWESSVNAFKNDMLSFEESRKLRYTLESITNLAEQVQAIRSTIESDKQTSDLAKRLLISDRDIERILKDLVRIDKYKIDMKDSSFETMGVPPDRRVPSLEKRFFVQIYDGAMNYITIQPSAYKVSP